LHNDGSVIYSMPKSVSLQEKLTVVYLGFLLAVQISPSV